MTKPKLKECPASGTPFLYLDSQKNKTRVIIQASCKMWNCPYCGIIKANRHRIRIINGIDKIQRKKQCVSFVTITSHERLKTTEQCLFVWRKSWRKLQERLRRVHKNNSKYPLSLVYVTELHKDRRLHWHMLVNCLVHTRWWKDNARECGLGHQCKSSEMEDGFQAGNYITKYLSKSLAQADYPKKMRRINYSKSFPIVSDDISSDSWEVLNAKESIIGCIQEGWKKDLSVKFKGQEIREILYE